MTAKDRVRELLDKLPDDCSLDDVLYHLYVVNAVQQGEDAALRGDVIPQAEVEERLRRRWGLGAGA